MPDAQAGPLRDLIASEDLASTSKKILVIEGQADAVKDAVEMFGAEYAYAAWSASINLWKWSDLASKQVLIWASNYADSIQQSRELGRNLAPICKAVWLINPEIDPKPQDYFDINDAKNLGWKATDLQTWMEGRTHKFERQNPKTVVVAMDDEKPDSLSLDAAASWSSMGLAIKNKMPVSNMANCLLILDKIPKLKDSIWYDEFHAGIFTNLNCAFGEKREWQDVDTLRILLFIQQQLQITGMKKEAVWEAIEVYAHQRVRSEPKDWMESLVWDGKDRLSTFCREYLGAKEEGIEAYLSAVGRNLFISMAARIYQPGCKADCMVILEGEQGIFKSRLLAAIGGPWYMDCRTDIANHERFASVIRGMMLIEISELDSFRRAGKETLKAALSCQVDRFRPAYGRLEKQFPRRCVFVGTTNQNDYLTDEENRRFWPVPCGKIELEKVKQDRDQLFAQAVKEFKDGANWYYVPLEEAKSVQNSRKTRDEWEPIIAAYLAENYVIDDVTTAQIAKSALGLSDFIRLDKLSEIRIGRIFRGWGWRHVRKRLPVGSSWAWRRPNESETPIPDAPPEMAYLMTEPKQEEAKEDEDKIPF